MLFSLNTDEYNQSLLKSEMKIALQNWEPRVKVKRIDTSFVNDSNSVEVIVDYEIIGQPNIPQEIQFVLEN